MLEADKDAAPRSSRGLLWRVPVWFVASVVLSGAFVALTFATQFGAPPMPLVVGIAIALAAAWAFGLFGSRTPLAGKVALVVASPFVPLAAIALLVLYVMSTMVTTPPQLFAAIDFKQNSGSAVDKAVTETLRGRFPDGTRVGELQRTLVAQGFSVDSTHRTARYSLGNFACSTILDLDWKPLVGGRIADIKGGTYDACL